MGATAQALGAATHEHFAYDEDGNLLTPNFYDYHVPHALDMPPLKTGFDREPVAVHAARHEGHGRGRRRRHPCDLRGGPGRAARARRRDRLRTAATRTTASGRCSASPAEAGAPRRGGRRMNVSGERTFAAPREPSGGVLNDPAAMAKTMPGVESFDVHDDQALDGQREDPARPRRPADEDRHGQDRGARAGVRRS